MPNQRDYSLTGPISPSKAISPEREEAFLRRMQWLVTTALASFYAIALIVDRAAGVLYGVLIALGLIALIYRGKTYSPQFGRLIHKYWPLALAMASLMLAVLANEISRGQLSSRNIDAPSRLALFVLVLWTISLVPLRQLRYLQWAFIAGSILSAFKIHLLSHGGELRYLTDFIPITIFIEMAMLLGVFCLLSIVWQHHESKLLVGLKLFAAVAVLYGSYISQSRGAWITIPVFLVIALISAKNLPRRYKLAIAISVALVLAGAMSQAKLVKERIDIAKNDIQLYTEGNSDTSIGNRFELWKGSVVIFKEHPVFGVGVDKYRDALHDLSQRKIITEVASWFAHSHNEFLFNAARLGLFGLIALLALYLVPAYYFARDLRHDDREVRSAAAMGLSLGAGIFVLGLTDVVFLWWEVFPFYAVSIATLLTFMDKRKVEAGRGNPGIQVLDSASASRGA
jgi:O-antigen ligase